MFAYVPSPTQGLIQQTGPELAIGESSLPVQRMDHGMAGNRHGCEGWVGQIRREQQERIAEECRLEEHSDAMDSTQKGGNQVKKARGAAGSKNAEGPNAQRTTGG